VPFVRLHGVLKTRAAGASDHAVDGATVRDALRGLERAQPAVGGWILDERGLIRRHIKVFVNGEDASEDTPVAEGDRIEVLQSISGGCR
jgi:molybdopterin synthase sulfur carrier subunit